MPSLMIHLSAAMEIHESAPLNFYIGNVAPDCIKIWDKKEHLHLRDRADRIQALNELYDRLDFSDPFQEGVMLHLYVDYLWDMGPRELHRNRFNEGFDKGSEWIDSYRREIGKVSGVMYKTLPWAKPLWENMESRNPVSYDILPEYTGDDIHAMISRNGEWHRNFNGEISEIYSMDYTNDFIHYAAEKYKTFIASKK